MDLLRGNETRSLTDVVNAVTTALSSVEHSHLVWILVGLPLGVLIAVRIVLYILRRAARRAIIQVKKLQETVSQGHFLDLHPGFIDRMKTSDKYCRVTSLASYLGSLDYGGDDDVAYKILSTLIAALGGDSAMAILPLIPASILPKKSMVQTSGLIARFTLTEFPSILALAATVDTATQFTKQVENKTENVQLPPGTIDSMDLLARGEKPGGAVDLPASLLSNEPLHLSEHRPLRTFVENGMDLGLFPDAKHYEFPKPFSPSLLPGLCIGNGGLEHTDTPRMQAQNRVLSAIMNKLSANFMCWAGFGPFTLPGAPAQPPYPEFKIFVGDGDDGQTKPIYTCGELVHTLVTFGGGTFKACIRTNTTAFGLGLCILDDNAALEETVDPTDGSKRFRYTQIPLAFCSRTGVVCPTTGSAIQQLSAHSAVEWTFTDNKFLGAGEVTVTFYTGVEGFTGFKPGGEWDRPWVRECHRVRELSYEEAIQAAELSSCGAVCSNVCVRLWKFPFGGYGGLGVCADSVAIIEHALRGRTTIFPLFMRGDAKSGLLYVMREHIRPRIAGALADFQILPDGDARRQRLDEFLEAMGRVGRTLIRLPNDIQVEPHEILDSLDRIKYCTMDSPFHHDQFELSRLKTVKDGWSHALKEFETDFAEVGKRKEHMLLTRQSSEWRL